MVFPMPYGKLPHLIYSMILIPVSTRRHFDVDTTSFERQSNVVTTLKRRRVLTGIMESCPLVPSTGTRLFL